jgi:FkbM family methyltransferase
MVERSLALEDDAPFGAKRLPEPLERFRALANKLGAGPISRRVVSLARRGLILGRNDPFDVNVFEFCHARLYPRTNRCERRVFLGVNSWDAAERDVLKAEIAAGVGDGPFVFVDCGANVGLYSLFAASEAARRGRWAWIVAIEPDPINLSRLRFNLSASGLEDAQVFGCALGDHEHTGCLLSLQVNRGEVRLAGEGDDMRGAVAVPVRTLPDVLREAGLDRVDAMKLDIEGAEYPTLRALFTDAPQSLWPSMVLLEIGKRHPRLDAYQLCLDHGYELVRRTRLNVILRHQK